MFEFIMMALRYVINNIDKIIQIIRFIIEVLDWLFSEERLKKAQKNQDILLVSLKERLNNGNYNVVNCLFNQASNTIVESTVIKSKDIDNETKERFRNKDMIVFEH